MAFEYIEFGVSRSGTVWQAHCTYCVWSSVEGSRNDAINAVTDHLIKTH